MGRHRLLSVLPPEVAAETVINRYVEKANPAEWAVRYEQGVNEYLNSPDLQAMAKKKLATWYSALARHRGEIASAYEKIKREYLGMLGARTTVATERVPVTVRV